MATFFRNKLESGIGTTESLVLTTPSNARTTVIGLSLTNTTPDLVLASIRVSDTVASTSAYYIKNVVVPANQSLRVVNGGEKLVLGPSTTVQIQSSVASSLDLVMSYVEII
jgi:hypothetical protein